MALSLPLSHPSAYDGMNAPYDLPPFKMRQEQCHTTHSRQNFLPRITVVLSRILCLRVFILGRN